MIVKFKPILMLKADKHCQASAGWLDSRSLNIDRLLDNDILSLYAFALMDL